MELAAVQPLAGLSLDDVFGGPGARRGRAGAFLGRGEAEAARRVTYGEKYRVAVAFYAAGSRLHLLRADGGGDQCLQPGARGRLQELESIAPGGTWKESFWIVPSGF